MKDVIRFLLFILYSTSVFFLPNNYLILIPAILNLLLILVKKTNLKKIIAKSIEVLPFILFTFLINCILDNIQNAVWIGVKLVIVCNITIIYSETISIAGVAKTIETICRPLKIFKVNADEIKIMVAISLSMLPTLKKSLYELKEACLAKNMVFNVKNIKIMLSKFFLSIISRVNEIEESLIAKGYSNEE